MRFDKRKLIGRTIVAVDMHPFLARPDDPQDLTMAHDPVITLDNGATLVFVVEETDTGEYGIGLIVRPKTGER